MKLTCVAIKIDLYKKCNHLFKGFLAYMHIQVCASTPRTRDLPEADEMSTDNRTHTVTKGNIHTRRSKWNSYEDVFITTNIKKYISKVSTNIPPSVWNWLMKLYMNITREDRMCKCTCKSNQIGYKWFPRFIRCVKHKKKVLYN